MRNPIGYAIFVAAVMLATSAGATQRFPPAIERELSLTYAPPCSLCHLKGNVGSGTAGTAFALAMRSRGMTGEGVNGLTTALAILQQDKVDSDGDGVTDTDELVAGTDPNNAGATDLRQQVDPGYGCGGSPAGRQGRAPGAGVALLAMAAMWRRKKRKHEDREPSAFDPR